MHVILKAICEGEPEHGSNLYSALSQPNGADDRWGAYCLFLQGQLLPAKDLLLRAKAKGEQGASVELATVLRHLGEPKAAWQELDNLSRSDLAQMDQALMAREAGALYLYHGQLDRARWELEEAWRITVAMNEAGQPLVSPVAQLLGYVYGLLGREAAALHYASVAISVTTGSKRLQPLLTRAQLLIYAGQYREAETDLNEACACQARRLPYQEYLTGILKRAQGQWAAALESFEQAVQTSKLQGELCTEFLAALGAATVLTVQHDFSKAAAHIERASRLPSNSWERTLLTLRQGYWQAAQEEAQAVATLTQARDNFATLDLPRETAWAELHLAESLADRSMGASLSSLKRAIQLSHAVGSVAALVPELRLLPRVTALVVSKQDDSDLATLRNVWMRVTGNQPFQIRLVTLGNAYLEVDGTEVPLGLKRTVELLAYLLARGPAKREQILTAMWPDDDPRRTSNYFHQAKHELMLSVPYLRVTYHKESREYAIECEGANFEWDAARLRSALICYDDEQLTHALEEYTGSFLPDAATEWVREERDAIERQMISVGLRRLTQLSAAGDYAHCKKLAQGLLKFVPVEVDLAEHLLTAILNLDGPIGVRATFKSLEQWVQRELIERPRWMKICNSLPISMHD
ncbi:transcriptional regulator, SARP family protein [Deinococcus sp. QL22]|uniref:transcriptional regulator, SARP family protein n=1 Tax=Deinococcus sp. QL22 TaxID=2939437 RepID=UPI002016A97F|nr:transcriptional regulator, SARP family protein [Deinococcus sp. QL22]UQN08016.1 transcriptional regulator, SARP family protein [Deinococcus sp. QL22]